MSETKEVFRNDFLFPCDFLTNLIMTFYALLQFLIKVSSLYTEINTEIIILLKVCQPDFLHFKL